MGFGQEPKQCFSEKQWQRKTKCQSTLSPELIGLICWIGAKSLDGMPKGLLPGPVAAREKSQGAEKVSTG